MTISEILKKLSNHEHTDITYCGPHYTIRELRNDLAKLGYEIAKAKLVKWPVDLRHEKVYVEETARQEKANKAWWAKQDQACLEGRSLDEEEETLGEHSVWDTHPGCDCGGPEPSLHPLADFDADYLGEDPDLVDWEPQVPPHPLDIDKN